MEAPAFTDATLSAFLHQLQQRLKRELPGKHAHLKMAPEIRVNDLLDGKIPAHAVESAVLIMLFLKENRLQTAVILRNEYDGTHSGQISLPGGKREPGDADSLATALRETREEIGIYPESVNILGQLSRFYVRPSNFLVYPYVGFSEQFPVFSPDPNEVQRVIEVDLFQDLNAERKIHRSLSFRNGYTVDAPGFLVGDQFMWGATAMIFSELMHLLYDAADLTFPVR
jgi:8-oxo-dGTP pyrophosphatase MutT (NUDIX family)